MTQWFQDRYIARDEHKQTVDYYRKLVVHLYTQLRDSRAQLALMPVACVVSAVPEDEARAATPQLPPHNAPHDDGVVDSGKVVHVDFRQHAPGRRGGEGC